MKRQYTVKMIIRRLAFVLSLLMTGFVGQAQLRTGESATAGKEFYVACLYSYFSTDNPGSTSDIELKVVVEKTCRITARYNASGGHWKGWNYTEVHPGIYTEAMSFDAMVNNDVRSSTNVGLKTFKSLSITSTEDITVYVINYKNASTDAATILPTKTWGTEYHMVTMDGSIGSQYAVVAKEAGTIVTLTNGATVQLEKGQVCHFGYNDPGYSITGKKVSANKPVAMFSGAASAQYIGGYSCASATFGGQTTTDHCYEQLWSTDKWGKEFFVWNTITPQTANWGGVMAIVAKEAGTNVTVSGAINGGNPLNYALASAGDYTYVCHLMTGLCKVVSTKPVMVFTVLPDPALTYIPPVDQRILRAILSPFKMSGVSNINEHSVEMLIPSAYWNQTVIKEKGAQVSNSTYTVTPSPYFNDWMTVRKSLPNADIKIEVSCPGGLLAYMYGYGSAETYGYLAGAGAYDLQNYFTIQDKTTGADTYYQNTNETTHTFSSGDNIVVKRTVERSFTSIKWLINNLPQTVTESTSMLHTLNFPASAFMGGENTLTMSVRYVGATADSLYVGKVWLKSFMSFGDAPARYRTAAHNLSEQLYMGALWELSKVQQFPIYSIEANTAQNDNALTLATSGGYTALNQTGFSLSGDDVKSTFNLTNGTGQAANLKGWIDFNRNGVFDTDEVATLPVPASPSTSTSRVLTWAGAKNKLRNGKTYLRLRLSTAAIPNAADTLSNGEVEDYLLNLNLLEVNKTVTPVIAKVGDTLTYNITLTNKSPVALTPAAIIDPIPSNTTYVVGSAAPGSNVTVNPQTVNGQSVNAVKWTSIASIAGGGTSQVYSFKVKIIDAPQTGNTNDSIISNVAYALINGDSIPSIGAACNLAEVEVVSFDAENDTVMTAVNTPVTIDVLANDEHQNCLRTDLTVTLSSKAAFARHGQAAVLDDRNIKYTPATGFYGIDSLRYILNGCAANPRRDSATVYIAALQSESLNYFACNGTSASMAMKPITEVTYYWYRQPTGGSPISGTPNATMTVTKDGSPTETFWVEARFRTIRFARHKIELHLLDDCGNPIVPPAGCATEGSVVWKEDFGGASANDNRISATNLIDGKTNYAFASSDASWSEGRFCLLKYSNYNASGSWHSNFGDHTYSNDRMRGYMMMVDGTATPELLYQSKIRGLCGGYMYVSLWAANLMRQGQTEANHPKLRIELVDSVGVVVAMYQTNELPQTGNQEWGYYGFPVNIPADYDSLTLKVYSNTTGSSGGNDFVIDDIELRLCVPKVTTTTPPFGEHIVCEDNNTSLSGSYTEGVNGFGQNLSSKWQYSATGNINNPDEWSDIMGSNQTSANGTITNTLAINSASSGDEGYYRMLVADAARIGNPNCCASQVIYLTVTGGYVPPDIRLFVKPTATTVQLNAYIDSLPYAYTIAWEPAAEFANASTGNINVSGWNVPSTHTYIYKVNSAVCGSQTAKAYVQAIDTYNKNRTETVYICKDLPLSRLINLNRIFGLATGSGGTWSYPTDPNGTINSNISLLTAGKHAGARMFDVLKAFNDASHAAYNHSAGHKQFEINYADGTINKTVKIVVY